MKGVFRETHSQYGWYHFEHWDSGLNRRVEYGRHEMSPNLTVEAIWSTSCLVDSHS